MKPPDKLSIKPYLHGNWQLIKHITDMIEVTSKYSEDRIFIKNERTEVVYIGTLTECEEQLNRRLINL